MANKKKKARVKSPARKKIRRVRAKAAAPRLAAASNATELTEAFEVFGRAQQLYPKLLARREYFAGELAKLDEALSRLRTVVGPERTDGARPAPRLPSGAAIAARGAPTIANLILSALSSSREPLTAAELASSVGRTRRVSKANLQNVLRLLREKGLVRASGKAKRFRYAAVSRAAAAGAAAKAAPARPSNGNGRSAKGRRGRPKGSGAPTVRSIVLSALGKDQPITWAQLLDKVVKARPDIAKASVGPIVTNLRKEGAVKVTGKPRDYRYTLA